jgi:hypothetical protein
MAKKTLVVITGGTIESYYDPEVQTPYHVPLDHAPKDSIIPKAMDMLGVGKDCDYYPICIKDSKENTLLPEMDALMHHIGEKGYDKVIVVQGTDTMAPRAQEFKRRLSDMESYAGMDKVRVVFTGAMSPLRLENKPSGAFRGLKADGTPDLDNKKCDGWGNLRRAYDDVQREKPGVYIEMGEGPWDANEVRKEVITEVKGPTVVVKGSKFVHSPGVRQDDIATGRMSW